MAAVPRAVVFAAAFAAAAHAESVDQIVSAYVQALGGEAAISRIQTRRLEESSGHFGHATIYWSAPDKVLRVSRVGKEGCDGQAGWQQTRRRKIERLPQSRIEDLQTDANPIRF